MKKNNVIIMTSVLAAGCLASTQAHAGNLFGIDVSDYQGAINWTSVASSGVKFAYAKATEGYDFSEQSHFKTNMTSGKAAGIQMGAYHFAHSGLDTPAQEASYFWNFAGAYIKADGKSIDPAIDFDVFSGHDGTSTYTAWFNQWAADVKSKTTAYMHPVLIATSCGGMCDMTTNCTLSEWVVEYNGQNLFTGHPWGDCDSCNYVDPGTDLGWTFWQVSSTGRIGGISGNVDFDAYNGSTVAELKSNEGVGGL